MNTFNISDATSLSIEDQVEIITGYNGHYTAVGKHSTRNNFMLTFIRMIIQCIVLIPMLLLSSFSANAWEYSEEMDKMRGEVAKYATTESKDKVLFGGFTLLRIFLGIGQSGSNDSFAYIKLGGAMGAFNCISTCVLDIKFDNDPITQIYVRSSDNLNILHITSPEIFIDKIKHSKKLIIEAKFISSGTHQLEFNVQKLKW